MSKKANPVLVGSFVLGAAALAVAGLLLFGGGQLLSRKTICVMYFGGSVNGLNSGASVNFRGVNIGKVTRVEVELDVRDTGIRTPVFIEIEGAKFRTVGGAAEEVDPDKILDVLVDQGLRGHLLAESLVTGLKVVEFDFFPETPIELVGSESRYRELPTVPSGLERLTAELTDLPLAELAETAQSVIQGLEILIRSPELQHLPGEVNRTLADLRSLVANLDATVGPLASSLRTTSDSANVVLSDVRALVRDEEGPLLSLVSDLTATSKALRVTMEQADQTLASLRGTLAGTSEVEFQLTLAMKELTGAARALRYLAESLERNPENLLRGKPGPGGRPR